MRFSDLLRMSMANLFKRKVRTVLTVLGVIIGVTSIVVMVSLGLGLSKATMEQNESYSSLTTIEVWEGRMDGAGEKDQKHLNDELIEELMQLPHVVRVDPELTVDMLAKYGMYEGHISLVGTTIEALEGMNIAVGQGRLPSAEDRDLQLFHGNQILVNFYNSKTGSSYWETGELPDIDLMEDSIFYILDTESYYNSMGGGSNENGQPAKKAKKHLLQTVGICEGTVDDYYNYSWNTYCDIEKLMPVLRKEFKGRSIPGQPTTSKGKPYKEIFYSRLKVNVDDMENVALVNQMIMDMGYQTYNDAEWIESEQQMLNTIQAVLGGIGAVSLHVAAIGITNTMMMSIYERTKEIGIMKVLGCDMRNIGAMFLTEAGVIGLLGGIIGLLLSYGLSGIINYLVRTSEMMGVEYISYIPFWLAGASLVFAIFVGMIAGFFPARRAMKLSPLAAIRNE